MAGGGVGEREDRREEITQTEMQKEEKEGRALQREPRAVGTSYRYV